ncbi:MAG: helix-turn-helix domain-containing protein [Lactobacillus sp.]|jgi:transcriptional regulator with XRE-family HTH domain|nr:helix-turn-helix domain-containing protein [Lactobacillus sp.]
MTIGQKIKQYRTEKAISQTQLAAKLLVSRQTISNWENNKAIPDMANLIILSQFFESSVDDFLADDIQKVETKRRQITFASIFASLIIFLSLCLFASIFLAVAMGHYWLILPFILLNLLLGCILLFAMSSRNDATYVKKVSKPKSAFIMLVSGIVSFCLIYGLLDLLNF